MNAVIIMNGAEKFAIIVDKLMGEQEFVVKPLGGQLASIPGVSGSTLLGNGKVVLIVNPLELIQLSLDSFVFGVIRTVRIWDLVFGGFEYGRQAL